METRRDYVFGTLDVALTSDGSQPSGYIMESAGLARLATVPAGSDLQATMTLINPATGDYEIVAARLHEAAANTAEIARGQSSSTARAWPAGTAWVHGPTAAMFANLDTLVAYLLDLAQAGGTTLSERYQGAWDPGTEYVRGQTVTFEQKLWEALSGDPNTVTPEGPTDEVTAGVEASEESYAGGPDDESASGGLTRNLAQQWTFSAAMTFDAIRVRASGQGEARAMRVGFSASLPSAPNAVTWLCYADLLSPTAAARTASVPLSSPLVVEPGDELWVVAVSPDGEVIYSGIPVTAGYPTTGGVTMGDVKRTNDYAGEFGNDLAWQGCIQAVHSATEAGEPGVAVWGLALDFGS